MFFYNFDFFFLFKYAIFTLALVYDFFFFLIFIFFVFIKIISLYKINGIFFFYYFYSFKKHSVIQYLLPLISLLLSFFCYSISLKKNKLNSRKSLIFYSIFNLIFFFFFLSKNILEFFVFYECMLLISVFLVLFNSVNKRSSLTSIYFLFWTQMGSFLVFLGVIFLIKNFSFFSFNDLFNHNFKKNNFISICSFFIFLGFGVKIPIWPFHFWITKVHVEANTGFSIFLSGILVKTAAFGLYKFFALINLELIKFFFILLVMSLIDVSFKLFNQNDFKKLIAYATIFEMNLSMLMLIFFSKNSLLLFFYFLVFHALLSGLFFFYSDIFYKFFNTRIVSSIKNLQQISFVVSLFFFSSILIFVGLPLTIKFFLEIHFLLKLVSYDFSITLLILITFMLFNVNFLKFFFHIFFSNLNKKFSNSIALSSRDFIFLLFFNLLLLSMPMFF